ncbi:Alcohol dehydrogenase GroES-like domain-containing protein [Bacillus sp. 491mf]|nr:Alcohol dehydrogenase GroES-like domain-containing protein [Bacillus sp. 491mf]
MEQHSLVLCGKKHLEWKKEEIGRLKEDELLIKTIAGAISIGAELPQYNENDKTETRATYPKETGYESYGEVISVGNCVESFKIGDRVVAFYGHKTLGIVKENKAIPIPRDVPYSFALLTILSCDAAKGVRKLNPKVNSKVLVTGVGTVGYFPFITLNMH